MALRHLPRRHPRRLRVGVRVQDVGLRDGGVMREPMLVALAIVAAPILLIAWYMMSLAVWG